MDSGASIQHTGISMHVAANGSNDEVDVSATHGPTSPDKIPDVPTHSITPVCVDTGVSIPVTTTPVTTRCESHRVVLGELSCKTVTVTHTEADVVVDDDDDAYTPDKEYDTDWLALQAGWKRARVDGGVVSVGADYDNDQRLRARDMHAGRCGSLSVHSASYNAGDGVEDILLEKRDVIAEMFRAIEETENDENAWHVRAADDGDAALDDIVDVVTTSDDTATCSGADADLLVGLSTGTDYLDDDTPLWRMPSGLCNGVSYAQHMCARTHLQRKEARCTRSAFIHSAKEFQTEAQNLFASATHRATRAIACLDAQALQSARVHISNALRFIPGPLQPVQRAWKCNVYQASRTNDMFHMLVLNYCAQIACEMRPGGDAQAVALLRSSLRAMCQGRPRPLVPLERHLLRRAGVLA
jgi:hypothetical protein